MRHILRIVLLDLIWILLVTSGSLYYKLFADPHRSGFFCNDLSIRYPYRAEKYNSKWMWSIAYVVPSLFFYTIEWFHIRRQSGEWLSRDNTLHLVHRSYPLLAQYTFGSMSVNLLLNMLKYGVGRLRPHFIDYCGPVDLNTGAYLANCSALADPNKFIEDYVCEKGEHWNLRLSFFSGHATHMSYMAIFTSLYIQERLPACSGFLKPLLQTVVGVLASYITYTRYTDNYHHASDLMFGLLVGSIASTLTFFYVIRPSLRLRASDEAACQPLLGPGRSKSGYEPLPTTSGLCHTVSRKSYTNKTVNRSSGSSGPSSHPSSSHSSRSSSKENSQQSQPRPLKKKSNSNEIVLQEA